jgi:hypothetical protein
VTWPYATICIVSIVGAVAYAIVREFNRQQP